MRRLIPLCAVTTVTACTVQEADRLSSAAIGGLDMVVDESTVSDLTLGISGGVSLGYTSAELVHVTVLDNGSEVDAWSVPADALTLPFSTTVDLLDPGVNEITIIADYADQTAKAKAAVVVPDPIASFELTPGIATVSLFEVPVTGQAVFGHRGAEPAVLDVQVEGATVVRETVAVPADTLTVPFAFIAPLYEDGPNEVVATLSYAGQSFTRRFTVGVDLAPPLTMFPAWQTTYDVGVDLIASGNFTVTPPAGYTTERVQWTVEDRPWTDASNRGDGTWAIAIVDPDIGDTRVAVEVTTATAGHEQTHTFYGTLHVNPVFDCDTRSMLPDADMIQNIGTEQRLMQGYFGQPDGGHSVQFVIDARPQGDNYTIVGNNTRYTPIGIETQFNVNRLSCGDSCDTSYGLTVTVDGDEICRDSDFASVRDY